MLTSVTITGADDLTNPKDLIELSKRYPFVEWGFLFLPEKEGGPRYPTEDWIYSFFTEWRHSVVEKVKISAHLCKGAVDNYIRGGSPVIDSFNRVQLNVKENNLTGHDVMRCCHRAATAKQAIITQYNQYNQTLHKRFLEYGGYEYFVLFDASCGKGSEISEYPKPFDKIIKFGYAGGLTPDNLQEKLPHIILAGEGHKIYIDAESGLRTDDVFDLLKVEKFLDICKKYM